MKVLYNQKCAQLFAHNHHYLCNYTAQPSHYHSEYECKCFTTCCYFSCPQINRLISDRTDIAEHRFTKDDCAADDRCLNYGLVHYSNTFCGALALHQYHISGIPIAIQSGKLYMQFFNTVLSDDHQKQRVIGTIQIHCTLMPFTTRNCFEGL